MTYNSRVIEVRLEAASSAQLKAQVNLLHERTIRSTDRRTDRQADSGKTAPVPYVRNCLALARNVTNYTTKETVVGKETSTRYVRANGNNLCLFRAKF